MWEKIRFLKRGSRKIKCLREDFEKYNVYVKRGKVLVEDEKEYLEKEKKNKDGIGFWILGVREGFVYF